MQLLFLAAGLLGTAVMLWRMDWGRPPDGLRARVARDGTLLALITVYWAALVVLMVGA